METINKTAISVDFGNADQDGAIRLITKGTISDIQRLNIRLVEGGKIRMTDGDVEATGILSTRDGMWVAVVDENGFKKIL